MLHNVLPRPIYRIFIDLDDTLVDFMGQVYRLIHNKDPEGTEEDWKAFESYINREGGDALMWKKLEQRGASWWANLPKLPWADDVWGLCNAICPNVAILTSPSRSSAAAAGKMQWAEKNYGTDNLIITKKKYMCAFPGSVLIDDWDKFALPWQEHGGVSVLMRREWSDAGYLPGEILSILVRYKRALSRDIFRRCAGE